MWANLLYVLPLVLSTAVLIRLCRYPDLGLAGTYQFGAAVACLCSKHGIPIPIALLLAFLGGLLPAVANLLFARTLSFNPLIAGIVVGQLLYGISLAMVGSTAESPGGPAFFAVPTFTSLFIVLLFSLYLSTKHGIIARMAGESPKLVESIGIHGSRHFVILICLAYCGISLSAASVLYYWGNFSIENPRSIFMNCIIALVYGTYLHSLWDGFIRKVGNAKKFSEQPGFWLHSLSGFGATPVFIFAGLGTLLERQSLWYAKEFCTSHNLQSFEYFGAIGGCMIPLIVLSRYFGSTTTVPSWRFHDKI